MANIFICGDTGQVPLLEALAARLFAAGHTVSRGPPNEMGQAKVYDTVEDRKLIEHADVAVFTVRHIVSRTLLESGPRLKGVCFPTIGVETLDLGAANDLGIIVGYGAVRGNIIGMAESTLMLILMLFYGVQGNIRLMASGKWRRDVPVAHQVEGKCIGLVGFGRIARALAERLLPLGVRILANAPRTPQNEMPPGVAKCDLKTLLSESDLVCLLTGLTPETRRLIGTSELRHMRLGAYLVNTGRGELIDEDALCEALRTRRIAGAALDTFTVEPLPADSALRLLDNVILTPHAVGHTVEGFEEFGPALFDNIQNILTGELPVYCKNPQIIASWQRRLAQLACPRAPERGQTT